MTFVLGIACCAVLVAMAFAILRAWRGPTIFDRILAVNVFGTQTVLLIALLGFLMGRPEFLDIALVYALISFIGTVAVLKYVKYGDLAQEHPSAPAANEPSNPS